MLIYVTEFLLFLLIGWIIDSTYCTLLYQKLVFSGYFRGVPLCPIYGFGGIVLIHIFSKLKHHGAGVNILVAGFAITATEYFGGLLAEYLLGERLWDYSKEPLNLQGYTNAMHFVVWTFVAAIGYFLYRYKIQKALESLQRVLRVSVSRRKEVVIVGVCSVFDDELHLKLIDKLDILEFWI